MSHPGLTSREALLHFSEPVLGVPFHVFLTPEDGVVRAAGFATLTDPRVENLRARLRERDPLLAARAPHELTPAHLLNANPAVRGARAALDAFNAGMCDDITRVPAAQRETPFRGEVWRSLRRVAAGTPTTYTQLATAAGRPSAVRAAASACANNLVALFVPCHRIIRGDGQLGGYLFGTELKGRLLAHESDHAARTAPSRE